ncbi:MAG: SDR family oxidoreductase [Bacteroidetes bacterium]|nr:SDR family oxidoreductase [Bacteroidota bacterium]
MKKMFMTGFPGFIATRLLRELFRNDAELHVVALVQQKFSHVAEASRARLAQEIQGVSDRLQFVFGDITLENLGIPEPESVAEEVTGIFHLAAAYDLAVSRNVGMVVNVEGTRNVVSFARSCRNLKRFDYVSTVYVSGLHRGTFSEDDFDHGQTFKNFYEETKFLAEKIVRNSKDIPSAIYRPGIVVGDSTTGETAKYDGPYYVLQTMQSLPNNFPFPKIGNGKVEVNLVPVDYVVSALARLSADDESIGKTFHLTDPSPLNVAELQRLLAVALDKRFVGYPLSPVIAKNALKIGLVRNIYRIPAQLIDYFVHDVHYDSSRTTQLLQKYEISCPRFTEYYRILVKFFRSHEQDDLQGILI